jgi:hypothetical protein
MTVPHSRQRISELSLSIQQRLRQSGQEPGEPGLDETADMTENAWVNTLRRVETTETAEIAENGRALTDEMSALRPLSELRLEPTPGIR